MNKSTKNLTIGITTVTTAIICYKIVERFQKKKQKKSEFLNFASATLGGMAGFCATKFILDKTDDNKLLQDKFPKVEKLDFAGKNGYHFGWKTTVELIDDTPVNKISDKKEVLTLSKKGEEFIKDYERFEANIYDANNKKNHKYKKGDTQATGDWTIGYGHKLSNEELKLGKFDKAISNEEAEKMFSDDVISRQKSIFEKYPILRKLNQNQFDAVFSIYFNMGEWNFKQSEMHNFLANLNENDFSKEYFSSKSFKIKLADAIRCCIPPKWDSNNRGIKNRRYCEYKIFTESDYTRQDYPPHLEVWSKGELP